MRYIYKQPLRKHEVFDLPEGKPLSLDDMQKLVGGYIESIIVPQLEGYGGGMLAIYGNEEAKLRGMTPNFLLTTSEGTLYDVVCGPVLILNYSEDGEKMIDLTDQQILAVEAYLQNRSVPM